MKKVVYSDINLDFKAHPITGDIMKATNAEAIKKSFRNLVLTNYYEVPFNPSIGSNIRGSLFENFGPMTSEFMKTKLRELAEEYEPRVRIQTIEIFQMQDNNTLQVTIQYTIIELNRTDNFTVFLERTR